MSARRKPRRLFRLAVLVVAVLAGVWGLLYVQWRLSPAGIASVNLHDHIAAGKERFAAADIAPFPWRRVCMLSPYNPRLEEAGWSSDDSVWTLMFEGADGEKHWIRVDFETIEVGSGSCYGTDAVFVVFMRKGKRHLGFAGE